MGQSLNALLQTIVHWFPSPGGVGIKFALAIIVYAGLVWRATLAAIWPGTYASWKGLVMVAGQSCITSLSIFPIHLTRNCPITNVPPSLCVGRPWCYPRTSAEARPRTPTSGYPATVWQARYGLVYDTPHKSQRGWSDPREVSPEEAQQSVSQGKAVIRLCCSPAIMQASHAGQESDSASTHQFPLRSRFSTGRFRFLEEGYG